jgi:hypothetical protein
MMGTDNHMQKLERPAGKKPWRRNSADDLNGADIAMKVQVRRLRMSSDHSLPSSKHRQRKVFMAIPEAILRNNSSNTWKEYPL